MKVPQAFLRYLRWLRVEVSKLNHVDSKTSDNDTDGLSRRVNYLMLIRMELE